MRYSDAILRPAKERTAKASFVTQGSPPAPSGRARASVHPCRAHGRQRATVGRARGSFGEQGGRAAFRKVGGGLSHRPFASSGRPPRGAFRRQGSLDRARAG
jgi:hypothetical protein